MYQITRWSKGHKGEAMLTTFKLSEKFDFKGLQSWLKSLKNFLNKVYFKRKYCEKAIVSQQSKKGQTNLVDTSICEVFQDITMCQVDQVYVEQMFAGVLAH